MMTMLNHEFTKRETVLLIVCAALVLGLVYYRYAYSYFSDELEATSVETLQSEMDEEQAKLMKMSKMKAVIERKEGEPEKELLPYNAQADEISALHDALSEGCSDVSVSWEVPQLTGDQIVRRNASVSFTTSGYEGMRNVMWRLKARPLMCLVRNLDYSAGDDGAACSMSLTFFENAEGVKNLSGLEIVESEDSEEIDTED